MAPPVSQSKPTDTDGKRLYEMLEGFAADNQITSDEAEKAIKASMTWGKINLKARNGVDHFFIDYCPIKLDAGVQDRFVKGLGLSAETFKKCTDGGGSQTQTPSANKPKNPWGKKTTTPTTDGTGLAGWTFQASPADFAEKLYAFDVKEDPSAPAFISPLHQVTLAGHPEVIVPWSDPYLLVEWEAFLEEAGVEIKRGSTEDLLPAKYYYKGNLLMESLRVSEGVNFKFFTPTGDLGRQIFVKDRYPKPEVKVSLSNNPEGPHLVSVYGREVAVMTGFPDDYSQELRLKLLENFGRTLQAIPRGMVMPILEGVEGESPLTCFIGTREKVSDLGWSGSLEGFGMYDFDNNAFWWSPHTQSRLHYPERTILHEVGGHAHDDFAAPSSGSGGITSVRRSALRDYYAWKLLQLLTREEIRLIKRQNEIEGDPDRREEWNRMVEKTTPIWVRLKKLVVHGRVIWGDLDKHDLQPSEFFAIVAEFFYKCLLGKESWREQRAKEPLLTLIGLDYLFHEYNVEEIGGLARKEVYSKKAFHDVLGIPIGNFNEEVLVAAGLISGRPTISVKVATSNFSLRGDGQEFGGVVVGIRGGWQKGRTSWGAAFDYSNYERLNLAPGNDNMVKSLDLGIWGDYSWRLGPLTLFVEPSLGVKRWTMDAGTEYSFWVGQGAGIGFLENNIMLTGQTKFDPFHLTRWQTLEYGLTVDLLNLLRYFTD